MIAAGVGTAANMARKWSVGLAVMLAGLPLPLAAARPGGQVIRVGPHEAVRSVAAAAARIKDGGVVEIRAGDYPADVAVWTGDRIVVRGIGGRVRMIAAGASAERKAIWVVRGGAVRIENIEFSGARVADHNGAGIRFERGRLTVRDCAFFDNENGILAGNDGAAELVIENSEFGHNGAGDGLSHNLYVGRIRKLTVTGSYFHHARVGHLLKSRAAENHVMYNRLTDEADGRASYELEFPDGGLAYVVGNVVEQGPDTENRQMISFGAEGYLWPRNRLFLVNNTLVDDRPFGGVMLQVAKGADRIVAVNNLLAGGELSPESTGPGEFAGNVRIERSALAADYRLDGRQRTVAAGSPVVVEADGVDLRPVREYVHPHGLRRRLDQGSQKGAFGGSASD